MQIEKERLREKYQGRIYVWKKKEANIGKEKRENDKEGEWRNRKEKKR